MFCCRVNRFAAVYYFLLFLLYFPSNLFAADAIGEATLAAQAEVVPEKSVVVGDQVFVGNEYLVGAEGTLTILFVDESVLTLLPGSRAVIEEFSMGDKGKKGKCVIKMLSGQYRWVPGKILADGGLQYIADSSVGKTTNAVNYGQPYENQPGGAQGKNGKGGLPEMTASNDGNAHNGGTTAGVFYSKKCEDCPSGPIPLPTFTLPNSPNEASSESDGHSAGIPIINTGVFSRDNDGNSSYIPPDFPHQAAGIGAGTNFIPADDFLSMQNGMMQMNPAATAAFGQGPVIAEPGMNGGTMITPKIEMGGIPAAPSAGLGGTPGVAVRGVDLGSFSAPSSIGNVTAPKVEMGTVAAPKIEMGTVAAPKIEIGTVVAPKIEMGTVAAPKIEMGTVAAPKVEIGTVAAPKIEIGTVVVPTTEIGVSTRSAPLIK